MYSKQTVVINKTGLHARPASAFIKAAGQYASKLEIKNLKTGKQVNAKSIVLLLTLAVQQGTIVEITAQGEDEVEAVNTLIALIDSGFGEV